MTESTPAATGMRTDYCGALRKSDVGRNVTVCGWVDTRRVHSEHLAFIDLRDHTGIVQCVVDEKLDLRSEYVVKITGTVVLRPEGMENPFLDTGGIDLRECEVEVLNRADTPPFPMKGRAEVDETLRLRHRYVDMRRDKMQRNLRYRAVVQSAIRAAMEDPGFTEIEPPTFNRFRVQWSETGQTLIMIINPFGPGPTQHLCQTTSAQLM